MDLTLKFVIHNRNREFKDIANIECNLDNKYDLVIGPIANDDLALLFRQFSSGLIDVDTLVREMKFKKLTYEKLLDEETGLYLEGASYVYEILKDEREQGSLIQNEY